MPIYEYECAACERRTEVLQKLSDPSPTECEECGGELKRLISAPAVQFKGTGWYVTDYGGRKNSDASSASEGEGKGDKAPKSEKQTSGEKAAVSSSGGGSSASE